MLSYIFTVRITLPSLIKLNVLDKALTRWANVFNGSQNDVCHHIIYTNTFEDIKSDKKTIHAHNGKISLRIVSTKGKAHVM